MKSGMKSESTIWIVCFIVVCVCAYILSDVLGFSETEPKLEVEVRSRAGERRGPSENVNSPDVTITIHPPSRYSSRASRYNQRVKNILDGLERDNAASQVEYDRALEDAKRAFDAANIPFPFDEK